MVILQKHLVQLHHFEFTIQIVYSNVNSTKINPQIPKSKDLYYNCFIVGKWVHIYSYVLYHPEYHTRRKVAVFVRIRVRNDDVLEALFLKE